MRKTSAIIALIAAAMLCGCVSAHFQVITSEFEASNFDKTVLSSWTTNLPGAQVSQCSNVSLVGGFGLGGLTKIEKSFNLGFVPKTLYVSFDLYLTDDWKNYWSYEEKFFVQVSANKQLIETFSTNFVNNPYLPLETLCGDAKKVDRRTRFSVNVPFTSQTLALTIEGVKTGTGKTEFPGWGIRNLEVSAELGQDSRTVFLSELNSESTFAAEAAKWTYSPDAKSSVKVQNCNGQSIIGGINAMALGASMTRKVTGLPPHSFLSIKLNGYWIDSVDINDTVGFLVDGVIVHELGRIYTSVDANTCGSGYKDGVQAIEIVIPHTGSSFEFKAVVNFDQTDESFGLRNFVVSVINPCPAIFSDANGQGQSLTFCNDVPNLSKAGWTVPIKGIYIPEGKTVSLFQDSDYAGKKLVVKNSDFNLVGKEYVLINRAFNIEVEEQPQQRLRIQQ